MNELSLYILDLVQNSIEAGARNISIYIEEDYKNDMFYFCIEDDGKGIPKEIIDKVTDPFYTTRKTRKVGLGLSLVNQLAKDCNGYILLDTSQDGTSLKVFLQHSHIDRPPLGNIADTLITLIAANPDINFVYRHNLNGKVFVFSTEDIKKALGDGIPICLPSVLDFIKDRITMGLSELNGGVNVND